MLSKLLLRTEELGDIHRSKWHRLPPISHLLFVDDLIFSRADLREAHAIEDLLDGYEVWSRQRVNWAKSALFCSHNTHPEVFVNLGNALQVKHVFEWQIFGFPTLDWAIKKESFDDIKSKVLSKVAGGR